MTSSTKVFKAWQGGSVLLGLLLQPVLCAAASPVADTGPILLAAAPMATAEPAAGPLRFAITAFEIVGNEKLASPALQALVAPFIGRNRQVTDLMAAKAAIIKAYNEAGFGLVAVGLPKVIEKDGVVRLRIVEVRPAKVQVVGNKAFSADNIRSQLPALKDGEMPDMALVDRQLQLANDNPSRALRLEFQPGMATGSADVAIQVSELEPFRIGVLADNTGNSATGRARAGVILHHSNLWDKSHVATVSFIGSPEKNNAVKQFGLSYLAPIPQWGDSVTFTASHSSVNNGLVANAFEVSGQGDALGVRYRKNLQRDAASRHALDLGLDLRQYKNVINFFGFNLGVDVNERPLSLGYVANGRQGDLEWGAGISHVRNLAGGSNNDDATYAASRFGARSGWNLWRYSAELKLRGESDWLGLLSLSGQETGEPLISGEQWGIGGVRSVRGFEEREVTGDAGQRVSLEVISPRFAGSHRLLAFVDHGSMHRVNAQLGELTDKSLLGYGLGWRWGEGGKGPSLSLDLAVAGSDGLVTAKNHQSAHFSAIWWF